MSTIGDMDAICETVPSIWFMLNSMINHRRLSDGPCVGLVSCVQASVEYVWTASTNEGATRQGSSSSSSSSSSSCRRRVVFWYLKYVYRVNYTESQIG